MFDPKKIKFQARILQKALLFNKDGKFLAIKRSASDFSRPNKWDLPGGWMHIGQIPDESMIIKVKNETGLGAKKVKLFTYTTTFDPVKAEYTFFLCYKFKDLIGDVKLSEEHSEYQWVTRDEFLALESADYLERFVEKLPN